MCKDSAPISGLGGTVSAIGKCAADDILTRLNSTKCELDASCEAISAELAGYAKRNRVYFSVLTVLAAICIALQALGFFI